MKIIHLCLADGYSDGLSYQENMIAKFNALENDVYVISTQFAFVNGEWKEYTKTNYKDENGINIIRIPFISVDLKD